MASPSKKRGRSDNSEDNRAECQYTVTIDPDDKFTKKGKKRRRADAVEEEEIIKLQNSPFAPSGKFRPDDATLDCHYKVEPQQEWLNMTRYNSFVLNQAKYFSEGFIYVTNDASITTRDAASGADAGVPRKRSDSEWVARILEIRASDEHHVYARVYWMYWPDEIPVGTKDPDNQYVSGRQPYHGQHELVASNHMDIINVVSVAGEAKVRQWIEENDDEIQDGLYWRQALRFPNPQLSSIHRVCKCKEPNNPDKVAVACSNTECGVWLHKECLLHDALVRTYEELGRDKPHHTPVLAIRTNGDAENVKIENVKEEKTDKQTGRPLSPPDNSVDIQQTIDAKVGDVSTDGGEPRKESEAPSIKQGTPSVDTSITAAPVTSKKKRSGRKKGADIKSRPYEGLFEAELNVVENRIEIKDLREDVTGGDKEWTIPLRCLVCNALTV